MTAFSDFPPPPDAANFMHNRELLQYLRSYADHFDLLPRIRFRHEVVNVRKDEKFELNGRWTVQYRRIKTDVEGNLIGIGGHHVEDGEDQMLYENFGMGSSFFFVLL